MVPLSVLDLSPIVSDGDAAAALRNTVDLARHAEAWGYRRYWLAEHHNMPGIASAATSIVIGHVAGATNTIRVGAGGIMLPNHSPLVIAEQFGTLATLYPGRIDLGVGRAPGTDQRTMRALRRNLLGEHDAFPQDVLELSPIWVRFRRNNPYAPFQAPERKCPFGFLVQACMAPNSLPRWDFPTPSHPILRRNNLNQRSQSIGSASGLHRTWRDPTSCLGSASSRLKPTPRQKGYSPRTNRPSSIFVRAGRVRCPRPSMTSKRFSMTAAGQF